MNKFLNFARPSRFLKPGRSLLLLILLCFHAPAFAALNDGLVAYYPFDGNANDISNYANHGTQNGSVQYAQSAIGKSLVLNGIDSYVSS
jgi:hypothetical protein